MSEITKQLLTRRSTSIRNLDAPAPSTEELKTILKIGSRVPDHGNLSPWYFVLFEGEARHKIGNFLKTKI